MGKLDKGKSIFTTENIEIAKDTTTGRAKHGKTWQNMAKHGKTWQNTVTQWTS